MTNESMIEAIQETAGTAPAVKSNEFMGFKIGILNRSQRRSLREKGISIMDMITVSQQAIKKGDKVFDEVKLDKFMDAVFPDKISELDALSQGDYLALYERIMEINVGDPGKNL